MSDARKRQEPGPPARLARRLIPMLALLAMGCRAEAPEHGPWTEVADSTSTRRLVESPALCTDCVRLDEVVAIGNAEGPGILVSNTLGFRDRAGNYWIGQDGPIRVFDPGGRFVRDVGRRGEGPMEFRFPLPFHEDDAGNLHAVDLQNPRISVITPGLTLDRTVRLPGIPHSLAVLPGGRYVVGMGVSMGDARGHPIHVLSRSGEVLHSFGGSGQGSSVIHGFGAGRVLAVDAEGRIFSAHQSRYRIEVWTDHGRRIIGFEGPRLNPYDERPPVPLSRENPPDDRIFGLRLDEARRLWVASLRLREDWYERSEQIVLPGGRRALEPVDGDQAAWFLGRIEVIDLERGGIIARSDHDAQTLTFLGDGLIIGPSQTGEGIPKLGVWRAGYDEPR